MKLIYIQIFTQKCGFISNLTKYFLLEPKSSAKKKAKQKIQTLQFEARYFYLLARIFPTLWVLMDLFRINVKGSVFGWQEVVQPEGRPRQAGARLNLAR